jgi:hypothetical protein
VLRRANAQSVGDSGEEAREKEGARRGIEAGVMGRWLANPRDARKAGDILPLEPLRIGSFCGISWGSSMRAVTPSGTPDKAREQQTPANTTYKSVYGPLAQW